MNCTACILDKKGIRAKNSPNHVCAKAHKKYKEPDSKTLKNKSKVYCVEIYDEKARTHDSTLFRLQFQFLNGYQVKRFSELWVKDSVHSGVETFGIKKCIWVNEQFYQKLVFL